MKLYAGGLGTKSPVGKAGDAAGRRARGSPTHASLAERMMKLLFGIIAVAVSGFLASVSAFVAPSGIPLSTQPRDRSAAQRLRADAEGLGDEACPGYPRCSGEYREKGCDGTGR